MAISAIVTTRARDAQPSKIASLTMSAVSSSFQAHCRVHSKKSAISVSMKVLPFPTKARS
jgi:hypothetical protein